MTSTTLPDGGGGMQHPSETPSERGVRDILAIAQTELTPLDVLQARDALNAILYAAQCPWWCGTTPKHDGTYETDHHSMLVGKAPRDVEAHVSQVFREGERSVAAPVVVDLLDGVAGGEWTGDDLVIVGELLTRAGKHAISINAEARS